MSTFTVDLHPDVALDIDEAYHWYEVQKEGLGERLLFMIRFQIDKIKDFPEAFGVKGRKGYREVEIDTFPYLIVYKIYKKKRRIFVASIHHTSKDPNKKYR
jgi:hypothetical protein